jgi:hypothetical protein
MRPVLWRRPQTYRSCKRPRQSVTNCGEGFPEGCRAASNIKRNPMWLEVRSRLMSANLEGDDVGGHQDSERELGLAGTGLFGARFRRDTLTGWKGRGLKRMDG